MANATGGHLQARDTQLGALLRRGWLAVVLGIILGLVAGGLLTKLEHKKYAATASVLVTLTGVQDSATLANSRTTGTLNLDTEIQLAKSTAVAQRVQQLDPARAGQSLNSLRSKLSITVPPNTEVLDLTYTAGAAVVAEQGANDFARAYLDVRQSDAQARLNAQLAKVTAEQKVLTTSLQSVANQLDQLPADSKQRSYASAQRGLLISQITTLNTQFDQLSSTAITPGTLLSDATEPTSPTSPSLLLNLAAGLAAGLLVGLLLAWLMYSRRRRMTAPEDVLHFTGLPIAGSVSAIKPDELVAAGSEQHQEYRRLVNQICATIGTSGSVLVTGVSAGSPVATVAANLAAVWAATGSSVGLLAADDEFANVTFDGPGHHPKVLSRAEHPALRRHDLQAWRGDDYLVVAAGDPQGSADAQMIASEVDAVLVVVEARSRIRDGRAVIEQLDAVSAPLLGTVLVPSVGRGAQRKPDPKTAEVRPTTDSASTPASPATATKPVEKPAVAATEALTPVGAKQGAGVTARSAGTSGSVRPPSTGGPTQPSKGPAAGGSAPQRSSTSRPGSGASTSGTSTSGTSTSGTSGSDPGNSGTGNSATSGSSASGSSTSGSSGAAGAGSSSAAGKRNRPRS